MHMGQKKEEPVLEDVVREAHSHNMSHHESDMGEWINDNRRFPPRDIRHGTTLLEIQISFRNGKIEKQSVGMEVS